jgi:hypothetical protein
MGTPQTFANLNARHLSVSMWICPIISACHIFQLLKPLFDFNKILWDILTEKYQPIKAVTLLETKINCCTYSIGCTSNWETFISWLNTDKMCINNMLCGWSISEDLISHQTLTAVLTLGTLSDNLTLSCRTSSIVVAL